MSRTALHQARIGAAARSGDRIAGGRQRSLTGGVLALFAWFALLLAPVAAQAMTRVDPGVPGALICSVNKAPGTESGKSAASHCPLCTLAQQAFVAPPSLAGAVLVVRLLGSVLPADAWVRPSPDACCGPPPRAPPLA
jgi:hypothetical protein